ncbi:MAG: hypothetical protein J6M34_01120 [Clostridia bacterium]|nr:hypothetical protein [Clostridia bacterium]
MRPEELEEVRGIKIRRQFFNKPLLLVFACFLFFFFGACVLGLADPEITLGESIRDFRAPLRIFLWLLVGFAFFSFFNLFQWGEVVCVLTKEGLVYAGGCIPWEEIRQMDYRAPFCLWWWKKGDDDAYCSSVVFTEKEQILLLYAPFFLLLLVKCYNKKIKLCLHSDTKSWISYFASFVVLIPLLAMFLAF